MLSVLRTLCSVPLVPSPPFINYFLIMPPLDQLSKIIPANDRRWLEMSSNPKPLAAFDTTCKYVSLFSNPEICTLPGGTIL